MAIALVQVKSATGTTGSPNLTLTSATTAGNLLVAMLDTGQNSGNPTFAAPAGWTSLTELTNQTFLFRNGQLFYYTNNPGGVTSVTFTATPAISGGWCLYVFEFSGVATTTPLDQEAQHVNLSGQGSATPSETITTTAAGDLILGWAAGDAANGATGVTGPASPWVNQTAITDASGFERAIASYQVQAAAGAITYQPTFAGVTDYIIAIISFKAAGGGPTTFTRTVPSSAAFLATATRSIPSSAALLQTNTRTVNTSGALLRTNTRSVPASAAFSGALVRSVPTSAALLQAGITRTIPVSAALVWTQQRSVQASGALIRTNTRAIVASGALLASLTRAIAVTASLSGVLVIQPNPTARSIALVSAITAKSVTTQQASGLPVATSVSLVASPVARSVTKL